MSESEKGKRQGWDDLPPSQSSPPSNSAQLAGEAGRGVVRRAGLAIARGLVRWVTKELRQEIRKLAGIIFRMQAANHRRDETIRSLKENSKHQAKVIEELKDRISRVEGRLEGRKDAFIEGMGRDQSSGNREN